jgi:hypothetical protein
MICSTILTHCFHTRPSLGCFEGRFLGCLIENGGKGVKMNDNCPKCNAIVAQAFLAKIPVIAPDTIWKGVRYQCPICNSVLSIGIDPVALKSDLADEIVTRRGSRGCMD